MLLRLEPSPRLPRIPLWLLTVAGLMLCAVAMVAALGAAVEREVLICNLRRMTGVPCPTCGSTRLVLAVLRGRPVEAFGFNPMVMLALLIGSGAIGFRLLTAHRIRLNLTVRARRRLVLMLAVLFLMNWAYLWVSPHHTTAPEDRVDRSDRLSPVGSMEPDRNDSSEVTGGGSSDRLTESLSRSSE